VIPTFKLHAYFVFHLSQRCMLFYGQLDPRDVGDATFTKLFVEAEKLLIGQSTLATVDNEQFVLLNHEDIISGALVSDVSKQDEKGAIALLTKLGKAFKRQYQAEIDEFNPNACDLGAIFGGFSSVLAPALNDFLTPRESKPGEGPKDAAQGQGSTPSQGAARQEAGAAKFPGGAIPPEELDEVLFHEYEDLTALYNVEMVDGIVSKNRIFIYANIGEHHEITVDYSNFPALPKITMPNALSDILAISRLMQGWNPECPARIVDVIAEIEQLVGGMHPAGPTQSERAAEVDGYMNDLGFDGSTGKSGTGVTKEAKSSASNELASRLLAKDKKGGSEGAGALDAFAPEPLPMFVDQIIDEGKQQEHKTSLRDMVAKQKAGEPEPQPAVAEPAPAPVAQATKPEPAAPPKPAPKPQKFVIRPRFVVDGEEVPLGKMEPETEPAKPAPRKEVVAPPKIGVIDEGITIAPRPRPAKPAQPEPELTIKPAAPARKLDEIDHSIDIVARPRPAAQPKSFAIPDVNDLDSFVPAAPAKRPPIKGAPASAPKPAPASPAKPAQKPAPAPEAKPKPKPKQKDDEDMFGWGEDGGEMEVKQSKVEIKDFDGPIKKIKDNSK
jgi:hypothetical protein